MSNPAGLGSIFGTSRRHCAAPSDAFGNTQKAILSPQIEVPPIPTSCTKPSSGNLTLPRFLRTPNCFDQVDKILVFHSLPVRPVQSEKPSCGTNNPWIKQHLQVQKKVSIRLVIRSSRRVQIHALGRCQPHILHVSSMFHEHCPWINTPATAKACAEAHAVILRWLRGTLSLQTFGETAAQCRLARWTRPDPDRICVPAESMHYDRCRFP